MKLRTSGKFRERQAKLRLSKLKVSLNKSIKGRYLGSLSHGIGNKNKNWMKYALDEICLMKILKIEVENYF